MHVDDLKDEVQLILNPEPDEDGLVRFSPHPRLSSVYGLASYYRGLWQVGWLDRDGAFQRVLENPADPLHETLQSITVPGSLLHAALKLFGDSLVEYHDRERRWDLD